MVMNTIFRGMTRESLDLAYNNVKAEPAYAQLMARYQKASSALYETTRVERDLRYGIGPRQRFDWFWCNQPDAPTFVFIHGGYWQNYAKEDLAIVAVGALGRRFNVALAEYTLAPDASMTQIVEEIRALLDYLAVGVDLVGFGDRPVVICGHSAGGHLAALHRSHPAVDIAVAVSGLFDLEPISLSWLNDKLKLTAG
jgi:arylformamidase